MLDFPAGFPTKLPSEKAVRSGEQLVCQGPVSTPNSRDYIVVPAADEERATAILAEVSRQLSEPRSSYYVGAGVLGDLAQHPYRVRQVYYQKLSDVRAAWVADGKQVSERVANQISDLRNIVRESTRVQSDIPTFVYDVVDPPGSNKKYKQLLADGRYAEVIDSAFRPSEKVTRRTLVAARAGSLLKAGSAAVLVADMSASAAAVYLAKGEEEQQAALESLGSEIGGGLGFQAGAQICVALSLTLNVAGLIGCGILIGGLSYGGSKLGAAMIGGQEANDFISKLKAQF